MECNKDEAMRAKDIAERKFTDGDFAGAKKFALKAQTLYPGLENISQMLTALEVYLSAQNKINGETDMYRTLGVTPVADDDNIKKKYKKLVLLLHPDKNKFIGADGAFQLVMEAFNVLSDKAKRSSYNSRRNIKTTYSTQGVAQRVPERTGKKVDQKVPQGGVSGVSKPAGRTCRTPSCQQKVPNPKPTQSGTPNGPTGTNGYHKPPTSSSARGKPSNSSTRKPTVQSTFEKSDSFWTGCNRCKVQYEFMRVFINQVLNCPHCQKGFRALEVAPPSNLSPIHPKQQQQQKVKSSRMSGPEVPGFNNLVGGGGSAHWSPGSGTTAYDNTSFSKSVPGCASQLINDRGKRERGEPHGAVFTEDSLKKRREYMGHPSPDGTTGMGTAFGQSKENSETGRAHFPQGISSRVNFHRELLSVEVKKMLAEKALMEIRNKLEEWRSICEAKEKAKVKGKDRHKQKITQSTMNPEFEINCQNGSISNKLSCVNHTEQETDAMRVPDPDFHVFDLDRSENCFMENQVWAAYDGDDGMPRFYAMIHEVISLKPFKVRMSWLNSKSNSEFTCVDWIERGFVKTCGEFRVGKHIENDCLNSFSHKVKWGKGPRGVVQIYPRKGDIWALYRKWSPDWDGDTPDEIRHAYEMVEVLEDYSEERGVSVAPVCKAAGFKTVFCKQNEPKEVRRIPKEEMFRFSYQVPSHILTGEEKENAPKGYVELDPAATPLR